MEGIFYDQLKGFFLSETDISKHLESANASLSEKEHALAAHQKEIAKVKNEVERVYQLYLDKQLDSTAFGRFYKPLEQRQKQLEDEEPRLQSEIDVLKVANLSTGEIIDEARSLYGCWKHLSFEEKRRVVESITERITVGKADGEVAITLCYLPSCENMTNKHRMLCDVAREMIGSIGIWTHSLCGFTP